MNIDQYWFNNTLYLVNKYYYSAIGFSHNYFCFLTQRFVKAGFKVWIEPVLIFGYLKINYKDTFTFIKYTDIVKFSPISCFLATSV